MYKMLLATLALLGFTPGEKLPEGIQEGPFAFEFAVPDNTAASPVDLTAAAAIVDPVLRQIYGTSANPKCVILAVGFEVLIEHLNETEVILRSLLTRGYIAVEQHGAAEKRFPFHKMARFPFATAANDSTASTITRVFWMDRPDRVFIPIEPTLIDLSIAGFTMNTDQTVNVVGAPVGVLRVHGVACGSGDADGIRSELAACKKKGSGLSVAEAGELMARVRARVNRGA